MSGSKENPGYVRNWTGKVAIPCESATISANTPTQPIQSADTNDCKGGAIIGGLLGAGIGGAISRGNGRWFAFHLVLSLEPMLVARSMAAKHLYTANL